VRKHIEEEMQCDGEQGDHRDGQGMDVGRQTPAVEERSNTLAKQGTRDYMCRRTHGWESTAEYTEKHGKRII
jgi:hypothetical protein